MDCTITSTSRRRRSGMTLVEVLVASAIGSMVFAALTNYVDLDQYSRNALDQMISEIRQADRVASFTTTKLICNFTDPASGATYSTTYEWNPTTKVLTKTVGGGAPKVLLQECQTITFRCFQRNPMNKEYN